MNNEKELFLTADQAAVGLRELNQLKQAAATLQTLFDTSKPVHRELAKNALFLMEAYHATLCGLLQVSTNGQTEFESRYADLRNANARIRELERQQGDTITPQMLRTGLKNLTDRLEGWWRKEGLGHTSSVTFNGHVCRATFSCTPYGEFRLVDSDTPVSDKENKRQWLDALRAQGFDIVSRNNEQALADNDANRDTLKALFAKRLPSATIFTMSSMYSPHLGVRTLREFEVSIRNLDEVAVLPGIAEF